jgi:hypothetical protein
MLTRRDRFFVSYTMRDGTFDALSLAQVSFGLESLGRPYVDLLQNRSRDPQRQVVAMLQGAAFLVALISPDYLSSEWVRLELGVAMKRGIPIVLANANDCLRESPPNIYCLQNKGSIYGISDEPAHNPALHRTANALRTLAAR